MSETRDRSVAFITAIEKSLATRRLPFPGGEALFHDELSAVWELNFFLVEQPSEHTAEMLAGEENRLHRDAHHGHRQVNVRDEQTGRRLKSEFETLGWECDCEVLMALGRPADREADTSRVDEVQEAELQPVRETMMRIEPWADFDDKAIADLLAAQFLMDDVMNIRRFAARVDDEIGSYCEMYSGGRIVQVAGSCRSNPS